MKTMRSKSVAEILYPQPESEEEQLILQQTLEKLNTNATEVTVEDHEDEDSGLNTAVSRHDLYHGLGRQGTKTQW